MWKSGHNAQRCGEEDCTYESMGSVARCGYTHDSDSRVCQNNAKTATKAHGKQIKRDENRNSKAVDGVRKEQQDR